MPTPNKYHPTGREYTQSEFDARSTAQVHHYLVLGYINPKHSYQWYGEPRVKPYNLGIKKANLLAQSKGLKFNKADYLNSLH